MALRLRAHLIGVTGKTAITPWSLNLLTQKSCQLPGVNCLLGAFCQQSQSLHCPIRYPLIQLGKQGGLSTLPKGTKNIARVGDWTQDPPIPRPIPYPLGHLPPTNTPCINIQQETLVDTEGLSLNTLCLCGCAVPAQCSWVLPVRQWLGSSYPPYLSECGAGGRDRGLWVTLAARSGQTHSTHWRSVVLFHLDRRYSQRPTTFMFDSDQPHSRDSIGTSPYPHKMWKDALMKDWWAHVDEMTWPQAESLRHKLSGHEGYHNRFLPFVLRVREISRSK